MRATDALLRQLTVANQLTLLRLAAVPALALALISGRPAAALVIFVAAAVTDGLDGLAARRLGQRTTLGAILDPAADKLLMLVTYVLLALPLDGLAQAIPAWLAVLVVARDVLIVLVAALISLTHGPRTFPPSRLGKWTAGFEMGTAAVFLLANATPGTLPASLLWVGVALTGSLVVASGLHYLFVTSRMMGALGHGEPR